MSIALELNCFVLGEDRHLIFPIDIGCTKTVGSLKELIKDKNKPAFNHVPAHALDIFKVSLCLDDSLESALKLFQPEDKRDHLLSNNTQQLNEVFHDPINCHDSVYDALFLALTPTQAIAGLTLTFTPTTPNHS